MNIVKSDYLYIQQSRARYSRDTVAVQPGEGARFRQGLLTVTSRRRPRFQLGVDPGWILTLPLLPPPPICLGCTNAPTTAQEPSSLAGPTVTARPAPGNRQTMAGRSRHSGPTPQSTRGYSRDRRSVFIQSPSSVNRKLKSRLC